MSSQDSSDSSSSSSSAIASSSSSDDADLATAVEGQKDLHVARDACQLDMLPESESDSEPEGMVLRLQVNVQ